MTAPPFHLLYTPEATAVLTDLKKPSYKAKRNKVHKALKQLRDFGPSYRGLNSHKYQSIEGPDGEDLWESYAENRTPGAWRIWWCYTKDVEDTLTIVTIGPHPD